MSSKPMAQPLGGVKIGMASATFQAMSTVSLLSPQETCTRFCYLATPPPRPDFAIRGAVATYFAPCCKHLAAGIIPWSARPHFRHQNGHLCRPFTATARSDSCSIRTPRTRPVSIGFVSGNRGLLNDHVVFLGGGEAQVLADGHNSGYGRSKWKCRRRTRKRRGKKQVMWFRCRGV